MKTLCYSVRLESMRRISDKCYKATSFDGSSDLIPASHVYGRDYDVQKSEAWWISAWILSKKNIQYSSKKSVYFSENGEMLPNVTIEEHIPEKVNAKASNEIEELKK